ncbi:MAG: serine hydrolase domain-containing protein, partial [Balneolaceae bacterium]
EKPFSFANKILEQPNSVNTIFGTGSRPIDYTIAGIMLLDQMGKLEVDDTITIFYENVPQDKQAITINHLMTGQSGLPDFFDVERDWNPDLQWISRDEAEQRLLNITLHFEPGSDRQHSHAAFGLLAAIIERVSGMDYYEFLKEHFFDPAEMTRTGEYGSTLGFSFDEFAEGGGPELIGSPNIPPNWGPTSWLIKGSGGMYSTLGDLQKFYEFIRSGEVLDEEHNQRFWRESVNLDGSMRGFELFTISFPNKQSSLYLFLNNIPDRDGLRNVFRALEKFLLD